MIGWLACKKSHLLKYHEWYADHGFEAVAVTTGLPHVINIPKATETVEAVVDVLEADGVAGRPVLVHGFSSGGYLCGQYQLALQRRGGGLKQNVVGQLYDSPVDVEGIPKGVATGVTENPLGRFAVRGLLELWLGLNPRSVEQYTASADAFKANLLATPLHMIYSHEDPVTDSGRIHEVLDGWEANGYDVTSTLYEGSTHVQHMRKHRQQYLSDLDSFCSKLSLIDARP